MVLTEAQAAVRHMVRDFAQKRLRPRSAAFEAAGGYLEEYGVARIYRDMRVCQNYPTSSAWSSPACWRPDTSNHTEI